MEKQPIISSNGNNDRYVAVMLYIMSSSNTYSSYNKQLEAVDKHFNN